MVIPNAAERSEESKVLDIIAHVRNNNGINDDGKAA